MMLSDMAMAVIIQLVGSFLWTFLSEKSARALLIKRSIDENCRVHNFERSVSTHVCLLKHKTLVDGISRIVGGRRQGLVVNARTFCCLSTGHNIIGSDKLVNSQRKKSRYSIDYHQVFINILKDGRTLCPRCHATPPGLPQSRRGSCGR